jgi:hypothetical protein
MIGVPMSVGGAKRSEGTAERGSMKQEGVVAEVTATSGKRERASADVEQPLWRERNPPGKLSLPPPNPIDPSTSNPLIPVMAAGVVVLAVLRGGVAIPTVASAEPSPSDATDEEKRFGAPPVLLLASSVEHVPLPSISSCCSTSSLSSKASAACAPARHPRGTENTGSSMWLLMWVELPSKLVWLMCSTWPRY